MLISPLIHNLAPHCRKQVRFPVVVRQRDLYDFAEFLKYVHEVLDERGITHTLMSDLKAKILTECLFTKSLSQPKV